MNQIENIKLAFSSIQNNILRSLLTMLIITVGITCLVGILTAIDSILFTLNSNFNKMGANSFNIVPLQESVKNNRRDQKFASVIDFDQANNFKSLFKASGTVTSIDMYCAGDAVVSYMGIKTNPTTRVYGIDENFLNTSAYSIYLGRNFTKEEVNSLNSKVILGYNIYKLLFDEKSKEGIGSNIMINNQRYTVLGVLDKKGATSGGSADDRVYLSLLKAKSIYGFSDKAYNVTVASTRPDILEGALTEAIGAMRKVRKLSVYDKDDFEIKKSDGVLQTLKGMTSKIRLSAVIIALLTLLGASIGLMNIMLVSVTERTKEIGIRKALGATQKNILNQFLIEAIAICLIGGIFGILLGIGMGMVVTKLVGGQFFIPWNWMTLGIVVCIVVGLISGMYPAVKASKLDPIEALRYE